MNNNIKQLSQAQLQGFLSQYVSMASGATLVHQKMYYPTDFTALGINQRNSSDNDFWATLVTKPSDDILVFGFVYLDRKENPPQENEDIYVLEFVKRYIKYFPRGQYERENPLYRGTHKGLKDFLRP